jgi:hypothetical protein
MTTAIEAWKGGAQAHRDQVISELESLARIQEEVIATIRVEARKAPGNARLAERGRVAEARANVVYAAISILRHAE